VRGDYGKVVMSTGVVLAGVAPPVSLMTLAATRAITSVFFS